MIEPLSKRDKAAIQTATRYADIMREVRFRLRIEFGRVHFGKPGTTSNAIFDSPGEDLKETEAYAMQIAVFALQRLARKYGSEARGMISREVMVRAKNGQYTLNLGELLEEHENTCIEAIVQERRA